MKPIVSCSVALAFLLSSSLVLAGAPKVEFYLTKYNGKDCLERAEKALTEAGFKLSKGTFAGEDRVGLQGEFKGAVGCLSEVPKSVVFVVAGPKYKTASTYARAMQAAFMTSE